MGNIKNTNFIKSANSERKSAVSRIRRAILDEREPADEILQSAPALAFEGAGARILLEAALNKNLPREYQARYANLILDKAPWAANDQPKKLYTRSLANGDLQRDKDSFLIDRAFNIGNEALAIRLASLGANTSNRQIERARTLYNTNFVEYVLSNLCTESDIFRFLINADRGSNEERWLIRCLDNHFPETQQKLILKNVILRDSHLRSFLDDFTKRILLPSFLLIHKKEFDAHTSREQIEAIKSSFVSTLLEKAVSDGDSPADVFITLSKLAYSWRNPQIVFPKLNYHTPSEVEAPEALEREWKPLIDKPFATRNGFTIYNRTKEEDLLSDEKAIQSRCLSNYVSNCCEGKSHIFSLFDTEKHLQSVFEIEISIKPPITIRSFIKVGKVFLCVVQHEACPTTSENGQRYFSDGDIGARKIETGPKHDAMWEFLRAVKSGKIKLTPEPYGETLESRENNALPSFIKTFGYYPSWENIDLTLQEFKKDIRRGASSVDEHGRLVYDTLPGADGTEKPIHLIDGTVENGGRTLSLRNMNAQEWLHATGMMEALHAMAGKPYTPPKRLTATLPPPETPEQYAARRREHPTPLVTSVERTKSPYMGGSFKPVYSYPGSGR